MKHLLLFCILIQLSRLFGQNLDLKYYTNLNQVNQDELLIRLDVKGIQKDSMSFHFPKMVPGTYSIYDFGRFVTDFKAYDGSGQLLNFTKTDDNSWLIPSSKKLAQITYTIEDSWDTKKDNVVFEPAGTNIDAGQVFVFNNHGIFGFFKGHEYNPIQIEIDRPTNLYAGTALNRKGGDENTDIFEVSDYHKLVDSPILFGPADTAIIYVGDTKVLIHTYSPTGKVKSKDLVDEIFPVLDAQRIYLGGKLPVDHYAFLIFLNKAGKSYLSGSAGALEHSYSSFYCMFEGESKQIAQSVRDVAAHEFFHIVTPLSIHSEEIHYFDFINPKMSQHLWLYEGVTEYAAQHVQVKQGLVSVERFLNQMSQKLSTSEFFKKNLSFTEMSKTCLDENKDQYANVYLKGALIGMCIDLKLRNLSKGKYGLQDLMTGLSKKYGIEKPFKDADLFEEIASISGFQEMKTFLNAHVGGTDVLPFAELMKSVGIIYTDKGFANELSVFGLNPMGGFGFDMKKSMLKVASDKAIDDFGRKDLGLKVGDLIKEWDGVELNMTNIQSELSSYASKAVEGYELKVTVLREKQISEKEKKKRERLKKRGKMVEDLPLEEIKLSAALRKVRTPQKHSFLLEENCSTEALDLRKSWLGNYKTDTETKN